MAPSEPIPLRLGRTLFRWRGLTPLPVLAVGLALGDPGPGSIAVGFAVSCIGETVRAWSVAHIGSISRTRSGGVGPLVTTGPFARSRNPIYVGNLLVGAGMVWAASVPLLLVAYVLLFYVQYQLIVTWEESRLHAEHGDAYNRYCRAVPRWYPRATTAPPTPRPPSTPRFAPRSVLRSERGTLLVTIAVFGALGALAWFEV